LDFEHASQSGVHDRSEMIGFDNFFLSSYGTCELIEAYIHSETASETFPDQVL
jgi:hypothetical protein